ncbi:AraC family transcriptional regulator [Balneolaceae bacterium YR4-1]|uniref:AraC family transcriptional regulator n=1 Tax=Halalkalibaculum roseum TaxID=2709311 RepID=A0A6M1SXZ3_9BACT|nr:helix-turn-helix domain-containing protein [Halalkalibaculum roseum]NGP77970.1 AraC family transcriptional regulator [Halalkalibaculum roseum]
MEQNFWTILITYATVQCFILVPILLAVPKGFINQRKWLAVILILVGLLSLNFLFEYFRWYLTVPHLIWATAPLWFLVGPSIYFFSRSAVRQWNNYRWYDYFHLLPFLGAVLYIGRFYLLSGNVKIDTLESFYQSYGNEPDYFLYAFLGSILIYSMYSLRLFNKYFGKAERQYSDTRMVQTRWIRLLLVGFIGFFLISLGYNLLLLFDYEYFIQADYITYLVLSLFIQTMGFAAILKPDSFFLTPVDFSEKETEVQDDREELAGKFSIVEDYMENEKPYKNPELRLSDLSQQLNMPAHKLSHIINKIADQNFFEFINAYRVREVKKCLHETKYEQLSLEGIARDCGFNSSASFYRVFKQHTRMTPGQFMEHHNLK